MKGDKPFYTIKELAEVLGVSEPYVRKMVYKGKIPARKWGRRVIVLKKELEEHLKNLPPVNPMVEWWNG